MNFMWATSWAWRVPVGMEGATEAVLRRNCQDVLRYLTDISLANLRSQTLQIPDRIDTSSGNSEKRVFQSDPVLIASSLLTLSDVGHHHRSPGYAFQSPPLDLRTILP